MANRTKHSNLPRYMHPKHGGYYYVRKGKWVFLSRDYPEALRKLAAFVEKDSAPPSETGTMSWLFDEYLERGISNNSSRTVQDKKDHIDRLRPVFGKMRPDELSPRHVARYLDLRGQDAPSRANKEIRTLSHVFTKAIRWGLVETNPCRGVQKNPERPRTRCPSRDEIDKFKSVANEVLRCHVDLKLLTGLRKSDILSLRKDAITEEGLLVVPRKTKQSSPTPLCFVWSSELREVIERIKGIKRPIKSLYLFCTRDGQPYIKDNNTSGFDSMWQRTMKKALSKGLKERFAEHDLRATFAVEREETHRDAQAALGHADSRTTRIYLRSRKATKIQT